MAKVEITHPQEKRKAIPPGNELPGFLALFFIESPAFYENLLTYQQAMFPSVRDSVAPISTPFSLRRIHCPRPKGVRSVAIWISCPFLTNAWAIALSNSGSNRILFSLVHCHLGASRAICGLRWKSIMLVSNCTCPCGCIYPPMTPNAPNGFPSLQRNPGMMV